MRTFDALKDSFKIQTAGFAPLGNSNELFIDLKPILNCTENTITFHLNYPTILRRIISFIINAFILKKYNANQYYDRMYWTKSKKEAYKILCKHKSDLIIAHGIDALPIASKLCEESGAKLVFNAHEYYPREFEENEEWRRNVQPYYHHLCKMYLPKVNLFINVSENIRMEYVKNFNVDSIILTNAADYSDLNPTICNRQIKIIHHGAALRSRNIELMIKTAELLTENFKLDLMLVPTDYSYLQELKELVRNNNKVSIVDPVQFNEIVSFLNNYDIGLYILPKSNFNNEMALPNKFFEFVQARLMLAVSPNPEMSQIIKKYDLGVVADDYTPESLASAVNKLTSEKINYYKNNSHSAASFLNSKINADLLLKSINELFERDLIE